MINPERIPDEAVEAHMKVGKWLHEHEARAAIAATLEAWPGMERHTFGESGSGEDYCPPIDEIFLPLSTEARDGE